MTLAPSRGPDHFKGGWNAGEVEYKPMVVHNSGCKGAVDKEVVDCLFRGITYDTNSRGDPITSPFSQVDPNKDVFVPGKLVEDFDLLGARIFP